MLRQVGLPLQPAYLALPVLCALHSQCTQCNWCAVQCYTVYQLYKFDHHAHVNAQHDVTFAQLPLSECLKRNVICQQRR